MNKIKNVFAVLLFAFSCNAFSQIPTNGLVAYYPFNGNANDESGNGHNGTVHGAKLTTDITGNTNSAYYFDGSSNYIEIPHSDALNLMNGFSISVQIKSNFTKPASGIINKANPVEPRKGYCIGVDENKKLRVDAIYDHSNSVGSALMSDNVITDDKWHFICFTYNGTTTKLYLDGVLIKEETYTAGIQSNTEPLLIGWDQNTWLSDRHFQGSIDEVRLYNRPLTDIEIKAISPKFEIDLTSGLVAYYPFNGNANDESGNGKNGTDYGPSKYSIGINSNGRNFIKDDNKTVFDYTKIPNVLSTEYSICGWIKLNDSINHASFIYLSTGYDWTKADFWLFSSQGRLSVVQNKLDLRTADYSHDALLNNNLHASYLNSYILKENKFYFFTVTYSNNTVNLYIDGKIYATYPNVTPINTTATNITLGANPTSSSSFNYLQNGITDELRIYNRILTNNEIQAIYQKDPLGLNSGLVAYYPFNGNMLDMSGNEFNATNHGATLTTDRFGNANSAYSLDGTSNYIDLSKYVSSFNFQQPASISFWVKTNADEPQSIFSISDSATTSAYNITALFVGNNTTTTLTDELIAFANRRSASDDYITGYTSADRTKLIDNNWHHIVYVFGASTNIYLDNKLLTTTTNKGTNNGNFGSITNANKVTIGTRYFTGTGGTFLKGAIDEFRIYNRTLDTSEIAALYYKAANQLKTQTIDFTTIPSFTYGAKDYKPIAVASSGLAVNFASSDTNVVSIKNGYLHIKNAGSCNIIASQAGNDTLAFASKSQLVKVKRAPLFVTTLDIETHCGQKIPAFSVSYFGFVNSDDEADLIIKPTASSKAIKSSPAGDYTITLSGGAANNYDFNYVNGLLKILPLSSAHREVAVCKDSTFKLPSGKIVSKAGSYRDSLKTKNGCDSIAIFDVVFVSPMSIKKDVFLCAGKSYIAGGASQTNSGVYHDTIVSSAGCDSLYITTNLKFEQIASVNAGKDVSICLGESAKLEASGTGKVSWINYTSKKITVNPGKTAIYKASSTTACGIAYDDVKVTVLSKPEKPVISKSGNILFINTLDSAKWYSLDGLLPNASNWKYAPGLSGKYFVITNNAGCNSENSDTIDFVLATSAEFAEFSDNTISVYPNPVVSELIIRSTAEWDKVEFYNVIGKLVLSQSSTNSFETKINVQKLASGLYYAKIYPNNQHVGSVVKAFVKK